MDEDIIHIQDTSPHCGRAHPRQPKPAQHRAVAAVIAVAGDLSATVVPGLTVRRALLPVYMNTDIIIPASITQIRILLN